MRFAFCVVAKHLAQLLYVVHRDVPWVKHDCKVLIMADADKPRMTKTCCADDPPAQAIIG
jgi:hypothetical protein